MTGTFIRLLPKQIADKIAAGEVITGPSAVVKELVENALDAGARQISVEISHGGKTLIRVTDDGCGIAAEEVTLALTPHATSKLRTEEDLLNIQTLGFRGEALASIAAVSEMTLATKTADAQAGVRTVISGGEVLESKPAGLPDGTDIQVRNLFFNTPARQKFLATDRAEATRVVDLVSRAAVAFPDVRFRMVSNGSVLFASPGKGGAHRAILTVFGPGVGDGLLEVNAVAEGMSLSAFVSGMSSSRKSKRAQTFFVNGRYVKDKVISDAVREAYADLLPEGRYPVAYLFLEINPAAVDVNVHPAKSEIRFLEPSAVKAFLLSSLRSALSSGEALPQLAIPGSRRAQKLKREEHAFYSMKETETDVYDAGPAPEKTAHGEAEKVDIRTLWSSKEGAPAATSAKKDRVSSGSAPPESPDTAPVSLAPNSLRYLTSVFATYLIAEDGESVYLIDQHAAHERIHYEKFLAEVKAKRHITQQLLTPYILQLPPAMRADTENWADLICSLGFEAEPFGGASVRVRAVPAFIRLEEATAFLQDIVTESGTKLPIGDRALARLISAACRASVKANDVLAPAEAEALLSQLMACENPRTCPHGRPVFVQLKKGDLERMFGRS
ncbi:MAG: DNA mismatch repair endonuclease MutL [Clostridiales Family XIII bacterium]|jgi:DNA mismatch repair protein MutL|nr:DNA mismatch repair endonuclease MutL [Clostridiales Family XIII bacterium]